MTAGRSFARQAGIGAAALGLAALAIGLMRPEMLVEAGVDRALAAHQWKPAANRTAVRAAPVSGDERFWLTRADADTNIAPPAKLLAVGDRLSIQSADRAASGIEIVDIKTLAADKLPDGLAEPGHEVVIVTGKLTGDGGGRRIRFILDSGRIAPAAKPATGHAAL